MFFHGLKLRVHGVHRDIARPVGPENDKEEDDGVPEEVAQHDRLFGHDKDWERISVKMKDDRIYAVGWYNANLKIMRVKVKLELSCRIVGRGTALWLEDVELKVNDKRMSKGMMKKALERIQPFLDMSKYNLPLYLTKIELSDGVCRVASRIPPRPLVGGIKYERDRTRQKTRDLNPPAKQ